MPPATALRSSCRPSPGSTPRPSAPSPAPWPTPRPSAAPCRSSNGRARASARRWTPGRRRADGRAAFRRRWRNGADGSSPPRAGDRPTATVRPSPAPTTGCSPPRACRACPDPPRRPPSPPSAARSRAPSPPPEPSPGASRPTNCCPSPPSSPRPTSRDPKTEASPARCGAGRSAIRYMPSARRLGAPSP